MSDTFKVEGLADLEASMMEMGRSMTRKIAERSLRSAGEPLADDWAEHVDVDTGHLERSVTVSTKLSRRQARLHVKKSDVEVFVGPDSAPQAIQDEFGNVNQTPNPAGRAAWDSNKYDVMFDIRDQLALEIEKAAKRIARRQARLISQAKG